MDIKLDREGESVFQIKLWKNIDHSFIALKLTFKISNVLKKISEQGYKNKFNSKFSQFHSLVNNLLNNFIPTKVVYHKNQDKWDDN